MAPRREGTDPHTMAAPYALNALPDREQARFERHLAGCEPCAQEVRGLRETAARLAAATATPPAPGLKQKVLAAVAATRQLPPLPAGAGRLARRWLRLRPLAPAGGTGASGAPRRPWVRIVASVSSAAVVAAAVVFGVLALGAQHRLAADRSRDHMLAAVMTAPDVWMVTDRVRGGGKATVVMSHAAHALAFSSAGLPRLPAGKAYELWLLGPHGNRSAAMLPAPVHGMTSPVVETGLRAGDRMELTIEPSGGSPRPTSVPLLKLYL